MVTSEELFSILLFLEGLAVFQNLLFSTCSLYDTVVLSSVYKQLSLIVVIVIMPGCTWRS